MKIRVATRQDLPAIKNLVGQHPRQLMQSLLPKRGDFFVAEEQGRIVGCCALEVYSRRLAEIRSLVVARRLRHQGLATRLIQTCLKKHAMKGFTKSWALPAQ